MPAEGLFDLGVFPPQVVAHAIGRDGVPDRHVPPGERAQQRLREHREHDVEPELEHRKAHDDEIQGRRGHFDLRGERRRDRADDDERADVDHGVRKDTGEGDHDLGGVVHPPEHRGAEHGGCEERPARDHIDDQEPERDRRGPDQAGDEPFAQDPRQLHEFQYRIAPRRCQY